MQETRRPRFVWSLVTSLFLITLAIAYNPKTGALTKDQQGERQIENLIPRHVPISIKIRSEKESAFKDLSNPNWAHDFELEVTNTGNKPIYFLDLSVFFDVANSHGPELFTTLVYGRPEVGDVRVLPSPEDIPINPSESAILKVYPGTLKAWDIKGREQHWALPTRVQVKFQFLRFEDHSGFTGYEAVPTPRRKASTQARSPNCVPRPRDTVAGTTTPWRPGRHGPDPAESWQRGIPASFLPVNFFSPDAPAAPSKSAPDDPCCPPGCIMLVYHTRVTCYGCQSHDDPSFTYCGDTDPYADCFTITT